MHAVASSSDLIYGPDRREVSLLSCDAAAGGTVLCQAVVYEEGVRGRYDNAAAAVATAEDETHGAQEGWSLCGDGRGCRSLVTIPL